MEQWITLIQEIGFPVIISFYLLHRIETKLEAIYSALVSLKNAGREKIF
ncbi:YvrJ family protein [Ureibacillus sp. FSL K6-8385]|uniref:YvrJ family protein n=1 Tax=Ureibacillus terrenus TaxID=118246 RepID=A0A540V7K3_9BACL|nr:YvrJ family protein [Ureibacillus terrenus]MED3660876.1 YvrJ family protein [Ureibacillus terrenus]MED3764625.1 YvrJ family protein [Ureibacillus terrenus]TQE92143.1 YvrJ family protein [Ureibacillus terrenus]